MPIVHEVDREEPTRSGTAVAVWVMPRMEALNHDATPRQSTWPARSAFATHVSANDGLSRVDTEAE